MEQKTEKKMGWEIAREVEKEKPTMGARAVISGESWRTLIKYAILYIVLFFAAVWLAGNPFEWTQRIPSAFTIQNGLAGTDNWTIVWWVVLLCAIFEYMDSAGGMGYGTALTPLLLTAGYDPKQVVPLVMITEMVTGLVSGLIHGEFENVEWKLKPMNETTRLTMLIAITGMCATMISVSAVYNFFQTQKFWIKLYVTVLLVVMGICSIMTAVKYVKYRPNLMWIFAFVGGFNKGVGGGGYGPVITVGGLISGVPVKSMVAVTSFAEGMTCVAAVVTWFALVSVGVIVDYMLLPSFVLGTVVAAVGAPYTTRIIPEIFWRWAVPIYCCILAGYSTYKIWPDIQKRLAG
jgi:uncharacterized membrane protein YfcA